VLQPGGSTTIENPESNRWFYIYVEAVDGAVWNGPFVAGVRYDVFNNCAGLGMSAGVDVGFLELDTADNDSYILTPG
jgi:hypothetical protein